MITSRTTFIAATALAYVMSLAMVVPAHAESHAETKVETEVAGTASAPVGVALGAELLEQLASSEEQMATDMAAINDRLAKLDLEQENADQLFDDMIAAVRRQALLGDPEHDFIQKVEKLIDDSTQLMLEAKDEGDTELVNDMEATVASLEVTRTTALELHADSARSIREIESQKSRFVLRIRAKRLQMAAEVARAGVERLKVFNAKLADIRGTIEPTDDAGTR